MIVAGSMVSRTVLNAVAVGAAAVEPLPAATAAAAGRVQLVAGVKVLVVVEGAEGEECVITVKVDVARCCLVVAIRDEVLCESRRATRLNMHDFAGRKELRK